MEKYCRTVYWALL